MKRYSTNNRTREEGQLEQVPVCPLGRGTSSGFLYNGSAAPIGIGDILHAICDRAEESIGSYLWEHGESRRGMDAPDCSKPYRL